jgi:tRNA threonylcarbamoyladenosine biosynthesis protein TsaE
VEGPERAGAFLPVVDLDLDIQPDDMSHTHPTDAEPDEARLVRLSARTPAGRCLLAAVTA